MWYCVPSLYFGLRQNYGKSNGSNGDLFQKTYASTMWLPGLLKSVPLTLQHATVEPCFHQRLPDTHRQVWLSLLLSPGSWCAQDFVCVLQDSLLLPILWKLCNQSRSSSKSDSIGFPVPRLDAQAVEPDLEA